jgi:hypothetical protein
MRPEIPDSFLPTAEQLRLIHQVREHATQLATQFCRQPEALKAHIESDGTPVYVVDNPLLALMAGNLGAPGFRVATPTRRHRLLCRLLGHAEFSQAFFWFPKTQFSFVFLSQQLYLWLAHRSQLPGFSEQAQRAARRFQAKPEYMNQVGLEELHDLRHALKREMESCQFLRDLISDVLSPSNQAEGLLQDGSASA